MSDRSSLEAEFAATAKNIKDFSVGQIYCMSKGKYGTCKYPYYVEVIAVERDEITTSIPGHHSTRIYKGNNWAYQTSRMTYVGTKQEFGHLLLNQQLDL